MQNTSQKQVALTLTVQKMYTRRLAWLLLLLALSTASLIAFAEPPVIAFEYDANGNLTKQTDGLNHSSTRQYDSIDRLIQVNQPHPTTAATQLGSTATQYNAVDAVSKITDPRNLATTYTKNIYGDILTQVSPDTGTSSYTYDNAGNLLTKADARGAVATYTYDALNRIKSISTKPSSTGAVEETITYTYDAGTNDKGLLTSMTDFSGNTTWSYNLAGQETRKQQRVDNLIFDLQTQYDTAGRLSRLIYPSGRYIDYQYNANGQIQHVWVNSQIMLQNIQYHPNGLPKLWTWGNNTQTTQTIDSDGRPALQSLGNTLQVISYDKAGRITQLHRVTPTNLTTPIAGTTSAYSYDNVDRLTSQVTSTTNTGYAYDLNGNRTNLTIGTNSYAYTIAATSNRLTEEAGPTPAKTYTYDAAGNITGNGQSSFSYYSSGRLKQVSSGSTTLYSLRYNGLGQFVHKTNNNTYYLYDQYQHLIGEYSSTGDAIQETVYLNDMPSLTLRPDGLIRTADNNSTVATNKATLTGSWTAATSLQGYYGTNYHTHAATATTTDKIVYTITPTATQSYSIYARWVAHPTNASNATYTIAPNTTGTTPTTITVNQQQNGGTWNLLTTVSLNTANNLTVTLSVQGNGIIQADAIRIIPSTPSSIQNNSYYIYTDYLNTPRLINNYANQTRWSWTPEQAEPFGANVPNENPANLGSFVYNLRFPGQLYDSASLLTYNYYRDYNSRTGRYIESDPIGLKGGINTYAYVGSNPLSRIDPLGLVAPAAIAACMANPGCVALATATVAVAAKACKNTYDTVSEYLKNHPEGVILATPPDNAYNPNGPKAPGKPGPDEGFKEPKGGDDWVKNPNGSGNGWRDKDGNVWVPTGPGGEAHGGPHWDVEKPGGGYDNVYPGGRRR